MRSVLLPLATAFLLGCATPSAAAPGPPMATAAPITAATPINEARAELLRYVGDVTRSTGYRYDVHDDHGHEMDGAKIIQVTETGEFAAVYHWFSGVPDRFNVSLATSTNLLDWTWRRDLTESASQPTIRAASDGGYVVTWDSDADLQVTLHYYASWNDLLAGRAAKDFVAKQQLPGCAEGTPNLYAASSTSVDFGMHFYMHCESDRQARGTTDWVTWHAEPQPLLDRAALLQGYQGSIGDRDAIEFKGHLFTFLEAQFLQGDWRTFRVLEYDDETGAPDRAAYPEFAPEPPSIHVFIRTHGGGSSFTNMSVGQVEIGGRQAIVVGLFVPSESGGTDAPGELIFYRELDR